MDNFGFGSEYDHQEQLAQLGGLLGSAGTDPYVQTVPAPVLRSAPQGAQTFVIGVLSDSSELPPFSQR